EANADGWLLAGLVVGRGGMIARLGHGGGRSIRPGRFVPWPAIVTLDDGIITIRNDVNPIGPGPEGAG
ncbi:MAG: hypothetical protein LC720_08075, partial [Actinobacteria bacterium]|nr:hypothetical protein [Actinomycetota bacterium]